MIQRTTGFAAAAAFALMGAAACTAPGQHSSPTAPEAAISQSLSVAGPQSGLRAFTDHDLPPDDAEFNDTNPCTGNNITLFVHFLQFTEHFNENHAGGGQDVVTAVVELTTSDGFTGQQTMHFQIRESGGNGNVFLESEQANATLGNGTGQRVVLHFVGRIVVVDGQLVVEIDQESLECRGKPVA
jgi:hypothetical protein